MHKDAVYHRPPPQGEGPPTTPSLPIRAPARFRDQSYPFAKAQGDPTIAFPIRQLHGSRTGDSPLAKAWGDLTHSPGINPGD